MNRRMWLVTTCLGVFLMSYCLASDVADLKAEVAALKATVAHMEAARMAPAAGGDAASLTSMKKKGAITIGGDVKVDVVVLHRDDGGDDDTTTTATKSSRRIAAMEDELDKTFFGTGDPYGAYLDFKISASKNAYLYIKLDIDDGWTGNGTNGWNDDDDLLEEIYFAWENVRGSNWDIIFGKKMFVDYGLDKYPGITPSLQDGWAYWMSGLEGASGNNQHEAIGTNSLPTAGYNAFQIEAIYHYKSLVNLYFTLFQDPGSRGMNEDRSEDNLFFQSMAFKAEYMPFENLALQASIQNQHMDSMGDKDTNGNDAESDQLATSISADWTCSKIPLNVWAEWQHGFDWTYTDDVSTDTISLGATYSLTDSLALTLMGEYADIENGTATMTNGGTVQFSDQKYYQTILNGTYTFENGIYISLEYAHTWFDGDITQMGNDESASGDMDRDADMFGIRTGWQF